MDVMADSYAGIGLLAVNMRYLDAYDISNR